MQEALKDPDLAKLRTDAGVNLDSQEVVFLVEYSEVFFATHQVVHTLHYQTFLFEYMRKNNTDISPLVEHKQHSTHHSLNQ